MDLETAQTTTTAKFPILKQGEYDMWRLRIEQYFQVQDYPLWDVIENGNSFKPATQTTTNTDGTSTTLRPGPVTTEEKVQKKNDVKARSMLLMALPNEHLMTFNQTRMLRLRLLTIQTRFGESLDSIFNRLQKIVSQLAILCENFSQEDLNLKFLRSLPSEWITHVVVWRNKPDLDTMSFDDLYNNFKIVEQEVKRTASSSSSSSSQNMAFVSSPSSTNKVNTAYGVNTDNTQVSLASTQLVLTESIWKMMMSLHTMDLMAFSDSEPQFEGYGPKTRKSVSEDTYNEVRESLDAPLVEELVLNDKLEKKTIFPTVAKIEFVRPKQQEKPVMKPVKDAEMYRLTAITIKGKGWNMIPKAVLMKIGLRPLNTARPVNTAHPKTIVYNARPMSHFSKSAYSTIYRLKAVNTARLNSAVVNALRCTRQIQTSRNLIEDILPLGEEPKDGKLLVLLKVPRKNNTYSVDINNIIPKESLTCLVAKATLDESMIWHRGLGHVNFNTINKLVKENLVRGLPSQRFENDQTCVAFLKGKKHKASSSKDKTSGILKWFITEIENLVDKKNRVLVVKPHNKASYELFRGKFDGKSDEGFVVGYSFHSDGPKWLFDIDVLTKSMNYVPIVACTNSNNFIGTEESIGASHSSKETRSSQDYILRPLWKDGSLFDSSSKNASNDEPQPFSDAGKKDDEGVSKESGIDDQKRPENSTQDVNTAGPTKSSQARRRARIVVSNDEDDLEDPSKQGRKIAEIDQDPGISLVHHDAEIQGRYEHDMEFNIDFNAAKEVSTTEKDVSIAEPVSTAGVAVTTDSVAVSTASPTRNTGVSTTDDITMAETLVYIRKSAAKDKGKGKMAESKIIQTKTKLQQEQERLDFEEAVRLQAELEEVHKPTSSFNVEEWEDIQARVKADEELVQRKMYFAAQRAEERRNKPPTQAQQRTYMSNYIKHMGGYTLQQLRGYSFDEIKTLFETTMRSVNTFVPIESEVDRAVPELAAGSSKRVAEEELDQESSKRQKTGESSELAEEPRDKEADELSQEELQQMMIIVPEQGMNVEALQTKYPIIDWEIYTEGTRKYWKIIRVGNHTEVHHFFDDMLKAFDRDDLVMLWSLVKEKFNSTEPTDDKEREIWVELKRLFEPDTDDELWKLQKHIHDLT
ncbi:reverse transcriptase domain-containing protein [Tanacetum coccineum]